MPNEGRVLNALFGALTLCAMVTVGLALRREFAPPRPRGPSADSTITNWREYATKGARIGPVSANVTITMFSDIRCVHCRQVWARLHEAQRADPEHIAIIYRHYPFKGQGLEPAEAGICANRQGKFDAIYQRYIETYDSLPEDQPGLATGVGIGPWSTLARAVGVPDVAAFIHCLSEPSVAQEIRDDLRDASRVGVAMVPTLLINSTRTVGDPGAARLHSLISQAEANAPQDAK